MLKPNFKEARKRTKEDIKVLRNEYVISDEMKCFGENKKYFIILSPSKHMFEVFLLYLLYQSSLLYKIHIFYNN